MNISLQDNSIIEIFDLGLKGPTDSKAEDKFLADSYAPNGLDVEDFIYRVAGTMGETMRSSTFKTNTE